MGGPLLEARFLGNLLEKSAFLASKLGNGPLLEHGPVKRFHGTLFNFVIWSHLVNEKKVGF